MLFEPGSIVFDSGRPALVAGGAAGSSVAAYGAGAPGPELDRTEGKGSGTNDAVNTKPPFAPSHSPSARAELGSSLGA